MRSSDRRAATGTSVSTTGGASVVAVNLAVSGLKPALGRAGPAAGDPSRRAVCGASSNKLFKAPEARSLTRASTQWPTLINVMMAAASMK